MPAGRHDMLCDQGEDWIRLITWIDRDRRPMGAEGPAHMQVRGDGDDVLITLVDADNPQYFDSIGGSIEFVDETGGILLYLPMEVTKSLPEGTYFYDLFVTMRSRTYRLIAGHFNVRYRRSIDLWEDWP